MVDGRPDGAESTASERSSGGPTATDRSDAGPTPDRRRSDGRESESRPTPSPPSDALAGEQDASGRAAFVRALRVRRNATWGVAVGTAFTAAVFALFVVLPGAVRSPLWFLALAFVLALSTAGLVAFLLTLVRAYRLSREL